MVHRTSRHFFVVKECTLYLCVCVMCFASSVLLHATMSNGSAAIHRPCRQFPPSNTYSLFRRTTGSRAISAHPYITPYMQYVSPIGWTKTKYHEIHSWERKPLHPVLRTILLLSIAIRSASFFRSCGLYCLLLVCCQNRVFMLLSRFLENKLPAWKEINNSGKFCDHRNLAIARQRWGWNIGGDWPQVQFLYR